MAGIDLYRGVVGQTDHRLQCWVIDIKDGIDTRRTADNANGVRAVDPGDRINDFVEIPSVHRVFPDVGLAAQRQRGRSSVVWTISAVRSRSCVSIRRVAPGGDRTPAHAARAPYCQTIATW